MRKNDLINMLKNIKGNPEILLWNPIIGDYNTIEEVTTGTLFKETLESYISLCKRQQNDGNDNTVVGLINDYEKYIKWESYKPTTKNIDYYKKKTVVFISPRQRGEMSIGRGGNIHY